MGDDQNFYGLNSAVVAAGSSAKITMSGCTVTPSSAGSNAIFSGAGASITVSDTTITNTGSGNSRGLHVWDGPEAEYTPEADDIPWSLVPEKKITIEDVKYVLSSHFQGTPYDPYSKVAYPQKGIYRPIGISRTAFMGLRHDSVGER